MITVVFIEPVAFLSGFLFDQIVGDPQRWPHPVIAMGKVIAFFEEKFNKGSRWMRRLSGALLTVFLVIVSFVVTAGLIWGATRLHPVLGKGLEILLLASTLAGKSLLDAGKTLINPLKNGDLTDARKKLSWFVSRDTESLTEAEIVRGAVETLAENFVDGILSPLFYMALGGAPLAIAFKAVSTLDSMIGYKNERYLDFGWFAARTDDWANYIPARLAVIILLLAGALKRLPVQRAYRVWKRDAKAHPSPNGGNPESIVAGLLGVQLGGFNSYYGVLHHRAEMGDPLHDLTWKDISDCGSLVRLATWLAFGILLLILLF